MVIHIKSGFYDDHRQAWDINSDITKHKPVSILIGPLVKQSDIPSVASTSAVFTDHIWLGEAVSAVGLIHGGSRTVGALVDIRVHLVKVDSSEALIPCTE